MTKEFYKPYKVGIKGMLPVLIFEDTIVFVYGLIGWLRAKEDARLMNIAYMNGVSSACSQAENGSEIFKGFLNY